MADTPRSDRVHWARSLRWIAAARARLADGWQPAITQKGPRWLRLRGGRLEERRLTPAHGVALDGIGLLDLDEGRGFPHTHTVQGTPYYHRHRHGGAPHAHHLSRHGSDDAQPPGGTQP